MKPAATLYFLARVALVAILSILLAGLAPLFAIQSDSPAALSNAKRMAASQHEFVMLLIQKKEYDQAAKEACKIFEMKWPNDQEALLLKELLILSDQFLRNGQPSISLHLIDRNAKCFRQTASQITILREKGILYKSLNQNDRALEYFRKAQELEDKTGNKN
jgi:tetratricopeptide (TPR) repeat protein